MLKNITLGQYFPGESLIHRLDPRTKLIATVALIAIVFVVQGFSGFLLIAAFVLACAASTGIHLKFLFKGLKPLMFIILFTFILNLFFQTGGNVLVQAGPVKITDTGLRMELFMAVRLTLLVVCSQLLTLTTSPISLTDGLETLFRPLQAIHFPSHEIAMMMSIALRFIPTLMDEADKIMKAQKARGAFRRAEELALAMDARCYRGGAGRTRMKQLKFKAIDALAALAIALLLAAVILLNRFGPF